MPELDPLVARRTWRTLEPLHGMIYFAPEAPARYRALGLDPIAGYFASRAAPLGRVGAGAVAATFFNFNPALVGSAIPAAWDRTTPADVLAARVEAADAALRRLLGDAVSSPEMARAATLARRAAEAAAERPWGRPLFAGHADLSWPDPPHLVLWHAQSLLREYRGDGHVAVLVEAGVEPREALVVHAATGEVAAEVLRGTRGWSPDEWAEAVARVRRRGWLAEGDDLALSEEGAAHHQRVEAATDRLAGHPYDVLGPDGCAELRQLCRPWSRAVVAARDPGSLFTARSGTR